jgi:hypothetical protein
LRDYRGKEQGLLRSPNSEQFSPDLIYGGDKPFLDAD